MDGKSFLLLTRDALMEFKGFRLGPALKIIGYSSYLRAKNQILNINTNKEVTTKQRNRSLSHKNGISEKKLTKNADKTGAIDKTENADGVLENNENNVRLKEFVNENTDPDVISPLLQQNKQDTKENSVTVDNALPKDEIIDAKIEEMTKRECEQNVVEMES